MIRKSLLPLTLVLVALSTAPAEAKRFRTYVSCGISDSSFRTPPSHSCPVGDLPQAVIINRKRASVRYRLCVRVPSGRTYCGTHRAKGRGRLNQRALSNEALGQHVISWYVGGRLVGRWALERTIGDCRHRGNRRAPFGARALRRVPDAGVLRDDERAATRAWSGRPGLAQLEGLGGVRAPWLERGAAHLTPLVERV